MKKFVLLTIFLLGGCMAGSYDGTWTIFPEAKFDSKIWKYYVNTIIDTQPRLFSTTLRTVYLQITDREGKTNFLQKKYDKYNIPCHIVGTYDSGNTYSIAYPKNNWSNFNLISVKIFERGNDSISEQGGKPNEYNDKLLKNGDVLLLELEYNYDSTINKFKPSIKYMAKDEIN
jgi:hypothetical protein